MLDLGADLQEFEMEIAEFVKERDRLGAYGADAAAIITLSQQMMQLTQLLRRSIAAVRVETLLRR